MRVSVYALPGGRIDVMVEASLGNGKPPVVVQDVKRGEMASRVGPVITAQAGRKKVPGGPDQA